MEDYEDMENDAPCNAPAAERQEDEVWHQLSQIVRQLGVETERNQS